jgi:hypothetical protein
MNITPTQEQANAALKAFLVAALPPGTKVVLGQMNRVPEPGQTNFVEFEPTRFDRLRTNVDSAGDVKFTGSIAGTVMTVTAVAFGAVEVGATVFGVGVAAGTVVTALGTGTGGVGTYTVSPAQTVSSRTLSAGGTDVEQGAQITYKIEFHGDDSVAANNAQIITTLFRDPHATESFAAQSPAVAVPLYAVEPRQSPFFNEQAQAEWRWTVEVAIQVDQVVRVPQQYADDVRVTPVSVDAAYPP